MKCINEMENILIKKILRGHKQSKRSLEREEKSSAESCWIRPSILLSHNKRQSLGSNFVGNLIEESNKAGKTNGSSLRISMNESIISLIYAVLNFTFVQGKTSSLRRQIQKHSHGHDIWIHSP